MSNEPPSPDLASAAAPEWDVVPVDASAVRPLRLKHLRAGRPPEDAEYRTDAEASAMHLAIKADGDAVAVVSCHQENRVAGMPPYRTPGLRVRGLAAEEGQRDTMLDALLTQVTAVARDRELAEVWANVRPAQGAAYQRAGFEPISSAFEIPGLGEHVVMALDLSKRTRKERKAEKQQAKERAASEVSELSEDAAAGDEPVDGSRAGDATTSD